MRDWIVIVAAYALGIGLLRLLGGLGTAADAFRRWGAASVGSRVEGSSPSS